jgi:hypothetical protein
MQATCRGETDLVLGLDEDDPQLLNYSMVGLDEDSDELTGGPAVEIRADLHQVVAWINELAVPRAQDYRAIGTIGDDNVPKTIGWDVRIMEALQATPFAFGNDLYPFRPPGELCCHVFMRSEIVAALGYFGPPRFASMYVDNAWMAWGNAAGITYLDDVIMEHLHHTAGKSEYDQTYAASLNYMSSGAAVFAGYCADAAGLAADLATIRTVAPW